MSHPLFAVSRFKNRNGVFSFRVDGSLSGVRIRRNFKTQEEAAAEKSALEIKALQFCSSLRAVTTHLSEEQVREAEAIFRRLAGEARSISFCVDYTLANYREPVAQQRLAAAVADYVATKTREQAQGVISTCQLTTIKRHLGVLERYFPAASVSDLSAARLTAHCQHGNAGG